MSLADLDSFIASDPWFDSRGHYILLYGIARAMSRSAGGLSALEIGTREGSTAICMLMGMRDACGGRLVSVDNDTDAKRDVLPTARRRVAERGLSDLWELHVADSKTWASPYPGYDLIFIDGDHSYVGIKSDFDRYSPMLNPHGLILLHDVETHPECRIFMRGLSIDPDWVATVIPFYNGLGIARRRADWDAQMDYTEKFQW